MSDGYLIDFPDTVEPITEETWNRLFADNLKMDDWKEEERNEWILEGF